MTNSAVTSESGTTSRQSLNRLDAALLVFFTCLILYASWFRSQDRIFWSDEIMGWLVLRQDTWPHLFHVWWGGIDSSGLFFYVFARPWLALFGATERSLHLFSAAGMALALILTWISARRYFRLEIVATCLPLIFFLNRTALWQLANGRTYGVLMTAIALTLYVLLRTSPEEPAADSGRVLTLTFFAFLLLVGSHILGPLYWGAFFTALLARDLWLRNFRLRLYLAACGGLIVIPISWRNLAATAALGKPSFWTLKPGPADFLRGLADYSRVTALLLLGTFLVFVAVLILHQRNLLRRYQPAYAPLLFALLAFALILVLAFAISRVSTSIFVDRYLLPMLLADALVLCLMTSRIADLLAISTRNQAVIAVLALIGTLDIYHRDLNFEAVYPQRDYTLSLLAALPPGEPVIFTSPGYFAEMAFYHNAGRQLLTPIDWSVQLDPDAGPGGASGTHEMENWKAYGFYAAQIQSTPQLLNENRHFVLVSDNQHTLWFRRYLATNPEYGVVELPSYPIPNGALRIWQVDRR